MMPDSFLFRNPNCHQQGDHPETPDYRCIAQVIRGMLQAARHLAVDKK